MKGFPTLFEYQDAFKAEFHVTYQALACNPVEGMIVESTIINITKAGVRAELQNFVKLRH